MTYILKIHLLGLFFLTANALCAQDNFINKKNLKKTDKVLEHLYGHVPEYKEDTTSESELIILKTTPRNNLNNQVLIILTHAKGLEKYFDFLVIYQNKTVKHIEILQYRSSHGYQITSKGWLKEFIGIKADEKIQIGQQVDAISGATLSSYGLLKKLNKINEIIDRNF